METDLSVPRAEVAYHEAPHFVASYRIGLDNLHFITIESHLDAAGQCVGDCPLPDNATNEQIESFVVGIYAGYSAQVRFNPASRERARAGAADDDQRADEALARMALHPEDHEQRIRALRARADAFVEKHWREISALAHDLLTYNAIEADEASLIVDAAAGDPDARAALASLRAMMAATGRRNQIR